MTDEGEKYLSFCAMNVCISQVRISSLIASRSVIWNGLIIRLYQHFSALISLDSLNVCVV